MRHSHHHPVIGAVRRPCHQVKPILVARDLGADPGVPDINDRAILRQFLNDIDHPGVADIRRVFLERQAHHQHSRPLGRDAAADHFLDQLAGDIAAHAVVDAAARQDHLGPVAQRLGLVGQVVGIDPDTVAPHQAGPEVQEIPLGRRRVEHLLSVDTHAMEDQGEFVDQGDVQIALGVLDHLGGLGHPDRTGPVGARRDDGPIQRIDELGRLRRRPRRHLDDVRQAVVRVAGIGPLRAVAGEEVAIEGQAGDLRHHRHAVVLGGAGIDGGFVDDDAAFSDGLTHGAAGRHQG